MPGFLDKGGVVERTSYQLVEILTPLELLLSQNATTLIHSRFSLETALNIGAPSSSFIMGGIGQAARP
jgi:hypothetical protein